LRKRLKVEPRETRGFLFFGFGFFGFSPTASLSRLVECDDSARKRKKQSGGAGAWSGWRIDRTEGEVE